MDEDMRTLWCGNLSEKVTEEILYELFLQGGPVQRVSIPKDRDGKQRTYGFVTYKHINSISYALRLFDGTKLFNRPISMSTRNNTELPQTEKSQDQSLNFNQMLQLGQQMILGNNSSMKIDMLGMNMLPSYGPYSNQAENHFHVDDRRSRRIHPYSREQSKNNNNSNHHRNHRSRSNHNHQSHDYPRRDYKSSRHNYC